MAASALAAISLDGSGGGVAVVARLLWNTIQASSDSRAWLIRLIHGHRQTPTLADKVRYALTLGAAQASGRVDWILYSHLGLAKPLTGMPRTIRRPYAVFLHGIEAWCPLPEPHVELLANARLRLSNSAYTARRVMQAHPGIGSVEPCPLALPVEAPNELHQSQPVRRRTFGRHMVLVVGRMSAAERYKGHDELIAAWPEVLARVPDAMLVMVGSGDDMPRLKAAAGKAGLANSVHFPGFVTTSVLESLYSEAALFALPSRGEGFGLVYLEAMRHRLACVGSVHDAAGDVIQDGRTGMLVNHDQDGALSSALVSLLLDEERRRTMGANGAERLRLEFTPEQFSRRLVTQLAQARLAAL
jgi:phosphatidylinositol alpha-1,6-mannosyltransferase